MSRVQGYVLIPVLVAVTLLAAVAALLTREGAVTHQTVDSQIKRDQLRLAAEAGLNHMKWQLNQSNCTSYVTLAPTGFGGNNYTATVNPASGTPVDITVTATLASGETHSETVRNITVQASGATATLQPGAAGEDAFVDSNAAYTSYNFGRSATLDVSQVSATRYALLRFDVSALPADVQINSATLELFAESNASTGAQASIAVHNMVQQWLEGTGDNTVSNDGVLWGYWDGFATWSFSTNHDPVAAGETVVGTAIGPHTWDITALVSSWVSRSVPNYGIVLKGNGFADHVVFTSSDGTSVPLRPKLTIEYAGSCDSPGSVLPQQFVATADAQLTSTSATFNYGASTTLVTGNQDKNRTLMKFDLSALNSSAVITKATLNYYLNNVGSGPLPTLKAYRVTQAWTEGSKTGAAPADGATWNTYDGTTAWATAGGNYSATLEASVTPPVSGYFGWVSLDVTNVVQQWINGTYANHGLIFTVSQNATITGASREDAQSDYRPYLYLHYQ